MAATTSRAAIVAAARTGIGTARKGALANVPAIDLAKLVVSAVIERSGLDAADFDDFVLAEVLQGGGYSARYIAVDLGLIEVPGLAVNRQCASSLSAIAVGVGQIASGMSRAILAGGMESLSTGPVQQKRKPFTTGKSAEDYQPDPDRQRGRSRPSPRHSSWPVANSRMSRCSRSTKRSPRRRWRLPASSASMRRS